jgi:hypothetical protein
MMNRNSVDPDRAIVNTITGDCSAGLHPAMPVLAVAFIGLLPWLSRDCLRCPPGTGVLPGSTWVPDISHTPADSLFL